MKERILHVSIGNDACMKFASAISGIYGHGNEDYAIAFDSYVSRVMFEHVLDFRTVGSLNVEHFSKMYSAQVAPDDFILDAVSPFLAQTYHIIQRSKGYDISTSEIERYYFTNIGFWESYLQKNRISMVLFYTYPHEGADFFIYQVSKALGLKTIINGLSLDVKRGYYISSIEEPLSLLEHTYEKLKVKYADAKWEEIPLEGAYQALFEKELGEENGKIPWYVSKAYNTDIRLTQMCGFSYKMAKEYYHTYRKNRKELGVPRKFVFKLYLYSLAAPLMKLDNRLFGSQISMFIACLFRKSARRTRALVKAYEKRSVPADLSRKYVYFPLHYQPECTSNPQGGRAYYNQAIPLRILSACLPDDVYIYVKEHPTQNYGARKTEFYDELLAIPRVVLVDSDTNSFTLLKNCIASSSLVGTAGLEGLFYHKPFLMFGYTPVMSAPGVYHIRTKEECRQAVNKIINGEASFTLKEIRLFFKAMDESEGYDLVLIENDDPQMEHIIESNLKLFQDFYLKIASN